VLTLDFGTGEFIVDTWTKLDDSALAQSNRIVKRFNVNHGSGSAVQISYYGLSIALINPRKRAATNLGGWNAQSKWGESHPTV
jgi:hypothetical protein